MVSPIAKTSGIERERERLQAYISPESQRVLSIYKSHIEQRIFKTKNWLDPTAWMVTWFKELPWIPPRILGTSLIMMVLERSSLKNFKHDDASLRVPKKGTLI